MAASPTFGQIVRERRTHLGLTQAELARRVSCATVTVRKIEYDAIRPSIQIAEQLAYALNIPENEQLAFVRLARSERPLTPIPTPAPQPHEIGLDNLSGRAVRGFELAERIGSGGFGVVYRGVQPSVSRDVAVKIIHPHYANHPAFIRRFEAEAQIVASLEHPHVVPLYDYWREPNVAYLIMRLLRGGSLDSELQNGPVPLPVVNNCLQQFGMALHVAHKSGIIHRDIKPANILLDEEKNAYLADFGIAKHFEIGRDQSTDAGTMVGSPAYISPEQIRSEPIKPQTDIYCLGIMLYELLTGQKPFSGPSPVYYLQQHLEEPLPSASSKNGGLPTEVDAVIARATAKNPSDRYGDMLQLMQDFQQLVEPRLLPVFTSAKDLKELENPYKGLRPFLESDTAGFFGRSNLVHDLLGMICTDTDDGGQQKGLHRFLALAGPSGSGKSSIVRAGLIPALRRGGVPDSENWFIVDMVPGTHPFAELEAALLRVAAHAPDNLLAHLRQDNHSLLRVSHNLLPTDDSELLLVIDQFEELFTLVTDETEREQFLNSLVTAVIDPDSRLRIIITLRADFLDQPLRYVDFGELVRERTAFVLPLSPDELEQAITLPAQQVGIGVEPGLVATMMQDVSDAPGALPLLQYALTELFEARNGRFLTLDAYNRIGGVAGALAQRADDIYRGLDANEQHAVRQMFLHLVTLGADTEITRRRVPQAELTEMLGIQPQLFEQYGRYRLLTFDRDPVTRAPTVEVAHESLLHQWARLRTWLNESRDDIRQHLLLAEEAAQWEVAQQDSSYLLYGNRLTQFAAWAAESSLVLTESEQAFLDASVAAQQQTTRMEAKRQQRELETAQKLAASERERADAQTHFAGRLRRRAVYLIVMLLLALAAAVVASVFADRNAVLADENADRAQALATQEALTQANLTQSEKLRLAAEANSALVGENSGELAALLAILSLRSGYSAEADEALLRALAKGFADQQFVSKANIRDLALSPDGRILATANSWDSVVKLWDVQTGEELNNFEVGVMAAVAFAPDGKSIMAGHFGNVAQLIDVATGEVLQTYPGHTAVMDIDFAPDGETAVIASFNGAFIWNVFTGKREHVLDGHDGFVFSAVMAGDGKTAVTGGLDGTVRVWDTAAGEELHVLSGHSGIVYSVDMSPDGTSILSAAADGTARLWDATTGEQLYALSIGEPLAYDFPTRGLDASSRIDIIHNAVVGAAFAPDGQTMLTSGPDNNVRMWDVAGGQLLYLWEGIGGDTVAYSADGRFVVAANDEWVTSWQVPQQVEPLIMRAHTGGVIDIDYDPAGQTILSGSWDNTTRVWDAETGLLQNQLAYQGAGPVIYDVQYIADSDDVWVNQGMAFIRWNLQTNEASTYYAGPQGSADGGAHGVAPDGSMVAVPGVGGRSWGWLLDGESPAPLTKIEWMDGEQDRGSNTFVAISPDGQHLLSRTVQDHALRLWNAQTGELLRRLSGHTQGIMYMTFSPDGRFALSGSFDGTARLWDVESGAEMQRFTIPIGGVTDVVFSPDGRFVLTGGTDAKARLWNVESGEQIRIFAGHEDTVMAVDFSPDGRYVITGSDDSTVRRWRVDLDAVISVACNQLPRDFTEVERLHYGITDSEPTCPP